MTDRPDLTTTDSDGLAIFSDGVFLWVTNETDKEAALKELEDEASAEPRSTEDFTFQYIPEDEMPNWEDASAHDYPTS